LSAREMVKFYKDMDIDNDGQASTLEIEVWFKRNEYIICRPWRKEIIEMLKTHES